MSDCLGADQLVTIGDALDWDVAVKLEHLQSCESCRARLAELGLIRAALAETEAVEEAVVERIGAALRAEAHDGPARTPLGARPRAPALEALLAGITAPVVVISSGIEIDGLAAGLICASAAVAVLLFDRIGQRQPRPGAAT